MRIVRRVAQPLPQGDERGAHFVEILLQIAAHGQRGIRLACAVDQTQGQLALRHAAGLPHLARIETNEIGLLASKRTERGFTTLLQAPDCVGERREMPLPIHRRGRARRDEPAHHAPPNTSILLNTQAGDAWPTRMICAGSPLPHMDVPYTSRVAALPTALRLRQKFAEMPR
jgi:hypothetical protein